MMDELDCGGDGRWMILVDVDDVASLDPCPEVEAWNLDGEI